MPYSNGIYYQELRNQVDPSLPPLVLLHGAGGSHLSWPFQVRRLPGVHVLALDLPGHGKSTCPQPETIAGYAGAVSDWLAELGLPVACLAGHSMGGAVALSLALAHPQQVERLVLLGTAGSLPVNPLLIELASSSTGFDQAVQRIVRWSFSQNTPAQIIDLVARRMREISPEVLCKDLYACNAFDLREQLPSIRQPALVTAGEADRMMPVEAVRRMAQALPQAEFKAIPGAGHMVMLEQPEAVARALLAFLARRSAQAD